MKLNRSCEVYIDGASRGNPGPASVGVVFVDENGQPLQQLSRYLGETTNNVAEYLALIYALQEALRHGVKILRVKTDSELLARQVNGLYKVRNGQLRLFHDLVAHLRQGFEMVSIAHVPREQNRVADRLAGEAVRKHTERQPTAL